MRLKLSKRKKAAAALASNGENPKGRRLVALKHKIRMFNQRRRRNPPVREKLSAILHRLAEDTSRERISCADLVHAVEDRAFGALLLIFSLPNIIPMPPGASGLLGLPLAFLSGQMMLGGKPWLPAFISSRSVERGAFSKVMQRVTPWLAKAEKLLRPRLLFLTYPAAETVLGVFCFVLSLSIILPIPLGNMLPAVAISLIALGILERDGIWIIAGALAGALALFVVSGIILALAKAALHVMTNAFS